MTSVVSTGSLSGLNSRATSAAAVFDLDGTLISNTISAFFQIYGRTPPTDPETASYFTKQGPKGIPYMAWAQGEEWPLDDLQDLRSKPPFQMLFEGYARRNHSDQIFARMAEELAQARACLNVIVLITGTFRAFAEPVLPAIGADHEIMNESFKERVVRGRTKPDLLLRLFKDHRLWAHRVYTDSDRPMLDDLRLAWNQPHIVTKGGVLDGKKVKPDLRALIEAKRWPILDRDLPNSEYAPAVRDYAANVIRSTSNDRLEDKRSFYSRWIDRLRERHASSEALLDRPVSWLDAMAVSGLYLRESDAAQSVIALEVQEDGLREICFELYQKLVSEAGAGHLAPLEFLTRGQG